MVNPAAEEYKELGNEAFAKKEYSTAIEHYTNAINVDESNHVYYSNRSACHAGNSQWQEATKDAQECIRISPTFIKGYYRLAAAQIELNELDEALKTVKTGLQRDMDNSQLLKQQRTIKTRKVNLRREAAAKAAPKSKAMSSNNGGVMAGGRIGAGRMSSANREVMELQQQYIATSRELNIVKANVTKSQREQKMNTITISELEKLPQSDTVKMYRGIGKMFMLSDQQNVMDHLHTSMEDEKKKELDLTGKMEYLERKIKSQQANIQEVIKASQ